MEKVIHITKRGKMMHTHCREGRQWEFTVYYLHPYAQSVY